MSEPKHAQWAYMYWNERFLCITADSGHGMYVADPDVPPYLLSPDVDDAALGKTICEALSRSRTFPLENLGDLLDFKRIQAHYEAWVVDMMARYDYKTRRAMFKQMLSCSAKQQDGIITFSPSRKDRLEAWGRTKDDIAQGMVDEIIASTESPEAVGAALRRAMSRCR